MQINKAAPSIIYFISTLITLAPKLFFIKSIRKNKKTPNILFLLLILTPEYCLSGDYPYEIVKSKKDFYLNGEIKEVLIQTYSDTVKLIILSKTYLFNENGILKEVKNKGAGEQPMRLIMEKDKIKEIYLFYGESGDEYQSEKITPLSHDEKERVNILKSVTIRENNLKIITSQLSITKLSYEKNHQTHKMYVKNENGIELINIKLIQFYEDGFINKICSDWSEQSPCDYGDVTEFSKNGMVSYKSRFGSLTEYTYKNGFLSEEKEKMTEGMITRLTYYDYKTDNCNNWIERKVKSPESSSFLLEKREIKYFKECN